jgi:prephenate dehydrogenase
VPAVRLAVLGVGLIGGSIGLAARARLSGANVCGWDLSEAALEAALDRGAIDERSSTIAEAVEGADVCFVCCPVGALEEVVAEALEAGGDCVISDVGSTKRSLIEGLSARLDAEQLARFVGGHPLAGAEASGVEHARDDLFEGATWYLAPTEASSGLLYERLYRAVSDFGARPVAIDAVAHDRLMATVSHLPHVLANVLVGQAAHELVEEGQRLPATGPSFRDATRVAGSNPAVWRDIFLSNREALEAELETYAAELEAVLARLREGDAGELERWIEQARDNRQRLLELELSGGPVSELRLTVPNRPGILARVTLALGEAGVNIVDMALYPAPDMLSGAIALWVAGESAAERAVALIGELGYPVTVVSDASTARDAPA